MQRQKGSRPRQNGRGGAGTTQPQALQATLRIDKVIRFKFAAALSNVQVTIAGLRDLLCVATSATAAYQLAYAFKLRGIEMWADPVAGGSLISIEDSPANITGVSTIARVKEDVTLGVARPAHLMWRPAPGSIQSMWQAAASAQALVTLTSSGAGYLDLHISYVLQEGETPVAVSGGVFGATIGQLYIRALDSPTGSSIVPVAYATI